MKATSEKKLQRKIRSQILVYCLYRLNLNQYRTQTLISRDKHTHKIQIPCCNNGLTLYSKTKKRPYDYIQLETFWQHFFEHRRFNLFKKKSAHKKTAVWKIIIMNFIRRVQNFHRLQIAKHWKIKIVSEILAHEYYHDETTLDYRWSVYKNFYVARSRWMLLRMLG